MFQSLPLRRVLNIGLPTGNTYPFGVTAIQHLDTLSFEQPITFFVGENGSGKSTLLETIACAARLPTVGETSVDRDPTLESARRLADALRWEWNKQTHRGFFMRAEDFFAYAKNIEQMKSELHHDLDKAYQDNAHRGRLAQGLAAMAHASQLHALNQSYGSGLDAQSHGESFLKLFQTRFVPHGLYLLDEPEAPLSPMRQLALLTLFRDMIRQGAQFIIATHSPILLAYPNAVIYQFDTTGIQPVAYDQLEHVRIMRDFLNAPDVFLHHLLADE